MFRSETASSSPSSGTRFDWRGWMALAWVIGSGLSYALMILREKAPDLLARLSAIG